jgi:hypothetical protein
MTESTARVFRPSSLLRDKRLIPLRNECSLVCYKSLPFSHHDVRIFKKLRRIADAVICAQQEAIGIDIGQQWGVRANADTKRMQLRATICNFIHSEHPTVTMQSPTWIAQKVKICSREITDYGWKTAISRVVFRSRMCETRTQTCLYRNL